MAFAPTLNLSDLDGRNGFVINGIGVQSYFGDAVSNEGDVNGDGIDDIIIGASSASPNNISFAGASYVIFGGQDFGNGHIELTDLDGRNGFVINGINPGDGSGEAVSSVGDINGDGFDDLIIGAPSVYVDGNRAVGESYIVFGGQEVDSGSLNLADLDGSNGFVIRGIDTFDYSGVSVDGVGDVNGDGIDDLIIGASGAALNFNLYTGESYVVFGSRDSSDGELNLSDLDGRNGFVIRGIDAYDFFGSSVSDAGDVNGDDISDLIIGASGGDPNGNSYAGESYVIFGSQDLNSGQIDVENLDGRNGFVINGIDENDFSGVSVDSAGDVNGDGIDDLIIGASRATPDSRNRAGESYVVFGGQDFGSGRLNLENLDGSNGFIISGIDARDYSGNSVSGAGDLNGDGIDDLIIGAYGADLDGKDRTGESYVVFGSEDFSDGRLDLRDLDGRNGFVINGIDVDDQSGRSVSGAGDINGDGVDDLLIGARRAEAPNGDIRAGETYVIFGRSSNTPDLNIDSGLTIAENTSFVVDIEAVDDNDNEGDGLIYSLTGGVDQALFNIDAATGVLSLNAAPDFENPNDFDNNNTYEVEVTVTNSGDRSNTQLLSVDVLDVTKGFTPILTPSKLDGDDGFIISGLGAFDLFGDSVSSAGDVNGDGIDDLIIGAPGTNFPNSNVFTSESYVIFGGQDFSGGTFDLATLNGRNGFVVNGVKTSEISGTSVSGAGDINGDGIDDLIIGAPDASPNGETRVGESYVVFGRSDFSSTLELTDLDGRNGFVIGGLDAFDAAGDSVSGAGDVNGDGIDDLIIGAPSADLNGSNFVGESYVVFGSQDVSSGRLNLADLDGRNGFVINGIDRNDQSGRSVSGAGDFNGDGIDDLIIGAPGVYSAVNSYTGNSYVIFGSQDFSNGTFDLAALDGRNGFVIDGIDEPDLFGTSVSGAGDINGDGFDDLIIGAPGTSYAAGKTYVVFGGQDLDISNGRLDVTTLDGRNGFIVNGNLENDFSGSSVSGAGDINKDGFDDLIIDANGRDFSGPEGSGDSYVVFGRQDFKNLSDGILELEDLDGRNGFVVDGPNGQNSSNSLVSGAGDVNGDGIDDLIIGEPFASSNGNDKAGGSYVIFGRAFNTPNLNLDSALTIAENTALVADIEATDDTDGEGNDLIYRVTGGADRALFTVDGTTGVLSFNTLPDFENPGDFDNDNTYEVEVSVTNSGDLSATQLLSINVLDQPEGTNRRDILVGTSANETLNGLGGNDTIAGGLGNDTILGGSGNDVLRGDLNRRSSQVKQAGGDDIIRGGSGNDRIGGKGGNDTLYGDDGDDRIWGDDGDDILLGGLGNDELTGDDSSGGKGSDIFVLAAGAGTDTITDFQVGTDFIGLTPDLTFADLSLQQVGQNVTVSFGSETLAVINQVNLGDLAAESFIANFSTNS